jgi:ribosome biogenesis protein Nip4
MMKIQNKVRLINSTEKEIIQNSLIKLDPNLFDFFSNEYRIYICFNPIWKNQNFPSIYLVTQQQHDFIKTLGDYSDIYSAGLYIGFIKEGKFLVSLEFLEFLKQQGFLIGIKNIIVNESGERSVLYGNNITKEMILSFSKDLKKNDDVIILNQYNELLAFGKYSADKEDILLLNAQGRVAINIVDIGNYLRKKQ